MVKWKTGNYSSFFKVYPIYGASKPDESDNHNKFKTPYKIRGLVNI